jgi:hypothetical protein
MSMILPKSNIDFDQLANTVANQFLVDGVALTDGVIKTATDLQLNPEQIKRLVERSNVFATVGFIKAASDKKAEFALADTEKVLFATHADDTASIKKEACNVSDIPVSLPDCRDRAYDDGILKEAYTLETKETPKKENRLSMIFNLEKHATELLNIKMATELQIQDNIDFIISEFSKWKAPDFSKFASESMTVYGSKAAPILKKIAAYIDEDVDLEKVSYVVDDTDTLLVKMGEVIDGLVKVIEVTSDISRAQSELQSTWDDVKGK